MITNTDLVALQLLVAAGNELPMQQSDIQFSGHAIEVRLCAEDATRGFLPSAGKLAQWDIYDNQRVRIETFVSERMTISPAYDSLLAKIIVGAENRELAIGQMAKVLSESYVSGVHTNVTFLSELIASKAFGENKIYTRYVDQHLEDINARMLGKRETVNKHKLVIAFIIFHFLQKRHSVNSLWNQVGFWRMATRINVSLEGTVYQCQVEFTTGGKLFRISDQHYFVSGEQWEDKKLEVQINQQLERFHLAEDELHTLIGNQGFVFEMQSNKVLNQAKVERTHEKPIKIFQNLICADLFGKVLKLNISEKEIVKTGQVLLTLESMKTEIHVLSPVDGQVKKIHVKEGFSVLEKQLLVELEPDLLAETTLFEKKLSC
jgi:acetyl/propionyl-CoA carboxylase alpha subunit